MTFLALPGRSLAGLRRFSREQGGELNPPPSKCQCPGRECFAPGQSVTTPPRTAEEPEHGEALSNESPLNRGAFQPTLLLTPSPD